MVIIYFDWCDYQYLKNSRGSRNVVWDFILKNRSNIIIPYSDFHLSDLYGSHPDFYLEDLEFISDLTQGYHCRYSIEENSIHLDKRDAETQFGHIKSARDELKRFSLLTYLTPEEIAEQEGLIRGQLGYFVQTYLNSSASDEELVKVLRLEASKNEFVQAFFQKTLEIGNFSKLIEDAAQFWQDAILFGTNYKLLRKELAKGRQKGGALEQLDNLIGGMKNHLKSTLGVNPDDIPIEDILKGEICEYGPQADYLHFYLGLDLMQIHPEKLKKKKSGFHNLYNDFGHSFLATNLSIFVSSDKDNREKTKLCIDRFNSNATSFSMEEFEAVLVEKLSFESFTQFLFENRSH